MIKGSNLTYVAIGAVGIYLADGIENRIQNPDESLWFNINHINRIAFYWAVGALAYFAVIDG